MNKKLIIVCMSFMLIFGVGIGAYAASDIRLFIHGKQVDADIQIINGSSYVPLRIVSEALGADVKWDDIRRTIHIKNKKTYVVDTTVWSGTLMMKISNITLDTAYQETSSSNGINAIIMDVSIENTAYTKLNWSPTKGKIQLNKNEIVEISNPNAYSDNLDGSYASQQVRKGKIIVKVDSNLDDIKTIDFMLDGATDGNTFNRVESQPIVLK